MPDSHLILFIHSHSLRCGKARFIIQDGISSMPEEPFPHYRKACFTHTNKLLAITFYLKWLISMHYADISKTVYIETNRLLQASTQISATSRCKNFRFFSTISHNYEYEF